MLADVPVAFPALTRAAQAAEARRPRRLRLAGPPSPILAKLDEEMAELRRRQRGDTAASASSSWATSCSPSSTSPATSASTPRRRCASQPAKFERRFRRIEALAAGRGQAVEGLGVEALDALWEEAKAEERGNAA